MNNTARHTTGPTYLFLVSAALIFFAGIILRFSNLGFASLWSDELYSVAAALDAGTDGSWLDFKSKVIQELTYHDSFITWKAADNTPPLFESILILWAKIFGKSDFALRSLPAVLGSLVPILFYFGSQKAIGKGAALLGSAFLAFSPTLIEYSQEVRAYMLACLLSTIAVTTLVSQILNYHSENKPTTNAAPWYFVIVLTILSYSHYTGFFTAGMLAAIYLVFISFPQKRYTDIAKFLIVPALIAPWMALSWKAFRFSSKGGYGWRDYHISDIVNFMIPNTLDFYAPSLGVFLVLGVIVLLVGATYKIKEPPKKLKKVILLTFAFICLLICLFLYSIYNSFTSKMWHPRYFVVSIPIVTMIFTLLISNHVRPKISLFSILIIFSAIFLYKDAINLLNPKQKPAGGNYRDAATFVSKHMDDRSAIVLAWRPNAAYYLHYLNKDSDITRRNAVFDVSYPDDVIKACQKFNTNFDIVYLLRHKTHEAFKEQLSHCGNIELISTKDFSDIFVDTYKVK